MTSTKHIALQRILSILKTAHPSDCQVLRRSLNTWSPLAATFNTKAKKRLMPRPLQKNVGLFEVPELSCVAGFTKAEKWSPKEVDNVMLVAIMNIGLFEVPELTSAVGFAEAERQSLKEADDLVAAAIAAPTSQEVVATFDRLSDALCRIADLADFIRVAHPDKQYSQAAEQTCLNVSAAVEKLNTNTELHQSLRELLDDKTTYDAMDEESRTVARLFMFDFEQSGIHLPDSERKEFVRLNEEAMVLSSRFLQGTQTSVSVDRKLLPDHLQYSFSVDGNQLKINSLLADNPDDMVREAAYKIYLYPNSEQATVLDQLLSCRHRLANIAGFPTFAHRALNGTMAKDSQTVTEFLEKASEKVSSSALEELELLQEAKSRHNPSSQDLQAWDTHFLIQHIRNESALEELELLQEAKSRHNPSSQDLQAWDTHFLIQHIRNERFKLNTTDFMPYFSLGSCMEGLDLIFQNLYGISLETVEPKHGEVWSPDIQKLEVKHKDEGILGYIFCDFYDRPGKPQQDCHFTIRGGRLLDDGSYQLPKVVLACSFSPPTSSCPTLLSHGMMENLFHEFGHAMHSMLARTRYQHVTGTRCATDFAEVPSILMEYFANDYRVLSQFARHYQSKETLPEEMISKLCESKKMFAAQNLQTQICYSMFDQVLHGNHPLPKTTTEIYEEIQTKYSSIPYVANTAWHLRFGHLVGYGAKYYSYLYSRAVAHKIWSQCFSRDPLNREMGERYRHTMLAHGGSKEGSVLVEDMLGTKLTTDNLVDSLVSEVRGVR